MSENKPKPHELFTITLYCGRGAINRWENASRFHNQGPLFIFLDENGIEVGFPMNALFTIVQQEKTPESRIIQAVGNNRPSLNIVGE